MLSLSKKMLTNFLKLKISVCSRGKCDFPSENNFQRQRERKSWLIARTLLFAQLKRKKKKERKGSFKDVHHVWSLLVVFKKCDLQ